MFALSDEGAEQASRSREWVGGRASQEPFPLSRISRSLPGRLPARISLSTHRSVLRAGVHCVDCRRLSALREPLSPPARPHRQGHALPEPGLPGAVRGGRSQGQAEEGNPAEADSRERNGRRSGAHSRSGSGSPRALQASTQAPGFRRTGLTTHLRRTRGSGDRRGGGGRSAQDRRGEGRSRQGRRAPRTGPRSGLVSGCRCSGFSFDFEAEGCGTRVRGGARTRRRRRGNLRPEAEEEIEPRPADSDWPLLGHCPHRCRRRRVRTEGGESLRGTRGEGCSGPLREERIRPGEQVVRRARREVPRLERREIPLLFRPRGDAARGRSRHQFGQSEALPGTDEIVHHREQEFALSEARCLRSRRVRLGPEVARRLREERQSLARGIQGRPQKQTRRVEEGRGHARPRARVHSAAQGLPHQGRQIARRASRDPEQHCEAGHRSAKEAARRAGSGTRAAQVADRRRDSER